MLSRQIYTPKYCENIITFDGKPSKDNVMNVNILSFEDESSQANPRTPTLLHRFGVLAEKKQCPTSPQNKIKHEIENETLEHNEQTTYIPNVQYTTHLSNELFDPTIVNTPPSEFMNQLKCRLDVYYTASS